MKNVYYDTYVKDDDVVVNLALFNMLWGNKVELVERVLSMVKVDLLENHPKLKQFEDRMIISGGLIDSLFHSTHTTLESLLNGTLKDQKNFFTVQHDVDIWFSGDVVDFSKDVQFIKYKRYLDNCVDEKIKKLNSSIDESKKILDETDEMSDDTYAEWQAVKLSEESLSTIRQNIGIGVYKINTDSALYNFVTFKGGDKLEIIKGFDFKHLMTYFDFTTEKIVFESVEVMDALVKKKLVLVREADPRTVKRISKYKTRGYKENV